MSVTERTRIKRKISIRHQVADTDQTRAEETRFQNTESSSETCSAAETGREETGVKEITLPEKMTIRELAEAMKMQPSAIVKKLFMEGMMVTVNHEIDFEQAEEIALGYDIIAEGRKSRCYRGASERG